MPDIYIAKKKVPKKVSKREEVILDSLKEKTKNPLAAFIANPAKLRFETQERKEVIILLLRRHFVTNIPWLVMTFLLLWVPLVVPKILPLGPFPSRYQLVFTLAWFLLTFSIAFEKFLTWFFNVNIITDERIVDLDFPSILHKDITETKIDQVQDVSVKVIGFIRSIFNFGDVWIQTAGAMPQICFEAVPNPERVARVLNELLIEEEKEKLEGRVS